MRNSPSLLMKIAHKTHQMKKIHSKSSTTAGSSLRSFSCLYYSWSLAVSSCKHVVRSTRRVSSPSCWFWQCALPHPASQKRFMKRRGYKITISTTACRIWFLPRLLVMCSGSRPNGLCGSLHSSFTLQRNKWRRLTSTLMRSLNVSVGCQSNRSRR